ncbi:MAG TPA: NAD-dependent epimerase/dehydratase family protein [Baekduia sp.]|nr:NAD-dependent epimerase/dehydratase family protein [Baekduia sp.]
MTRLLVLGGTAFAGRAVVEDAVARGWEVATFNRGRGAWAHPDVERITGDRLDPATHAPLAGRDWDLVVDTWSGAPSATRDLAALLAPRTARYAYVSSCSVYAPPPVPGADETAPLIEDDPGYGGLKRGSEDAVREAFVDRALLLRPGLILGPHEDVGRLPWWLLRLARGGDVLAPGPPALPLQLIDARDLARFTLEAAVAGRSGAYNTVSRRGHATMRSLLEAGVAATGSGARLVWAGPERIRAAGIAPWTELPIWLPPDDEYAALHDIGVEKAHAAGLVTRPAAQTVADTWAWLESLGARPPQRPDRPPPGLDAERERALLSALRAG